MNSHNFQFLMKKISSGFFFLKFTPKNIYLFRLINIKKICERKLKSFNKYMYRKKNFFFKFRNLNLHLFFFYSSESIMIDSRYNYFFPNALDDFLRQRNNQW